MKKEIVKNVIFKFIIVLQLPAFIYFLVYSCTFVSFVSKIISGLGWRQYFSGQGIFLPLIFFVPLALLGTVAVLCFYRKETSVTFRVSLSVLFVWELASFFATSFINSPAVPNTLAFLNLIPVAGFIAAAVVIIKELTRKKA